MTQPMVCERVQYEEKYKIQMPEDTSMKIMEQGISQLNGNKPAVSVSYFIWWIILVFNLCIIIVISQGNDIENELQNYSTMRDPLDVLDNRDLNIATTSTFDQYEVNFSDCHDLIIMDQEKSEGNSHKPAASVSYLYLVNFSFLNTHNFYFPGQ